MITAMIKNKRNQILWNSSKKLYITLKNTIFFYLLATIIYIYIITATNKHNDNNEKIRKNIGVPYEIKEIVRIYKNVFLQKTLLN